MVKLDATLEVSTADFGPPESEQPALLALMIAWAPAEPNRLGEVTLFDPDAGPYVLGRGEPEDARSTRVKFFRQRPGLTVPGPPLASPGLSREQLRIRVDGEKLLIEQIGRCSLEVDGQRVERCEIGPGNSILLKGQLILYCTKRPRKFESMRAVTFDTAPDFGGPDRHGIVGESLETWRLRDQLAWLGKADGHTLLLGASGSGKELCARALHASSARVQGPFVARNAATIPSGIIDAELFGNVKNYPNPGMAERPGLIGSADGGTLFLDEIGELPQNLQANLLRVLDEAGEYHNLGGTAIKRSNFRLLGATNRDPESLKHDLAARLVLRVTVPGLDERREDIPLLVQHLLRRALAKSPEIVAPFFTTTNGSPEPKIRANLILKLLEHSYSTNIRELDALLWRAMSESQGSLIEWPRTDTSSKFKVSEESIDEAVGHTHSSAPPEPVKELAIKEPSEEDVRASLTAHNGNIVRTAKALGLSSRYVLYRLMRKYGIPSE